MLRLSDDEFAGLASAPLVEEGPVSTGCSVIDELERAFWAEDPSLVTWSKEGSSDG